MTYMQHSFAKNFILLSTITEKTVFFSKVFFIKTNCKKTIPKSVKMYWQKRKLEIDAELSSLHKKQNTLHLERQELEYLQKHPVVSLLQSLLPLPILTICNEYNTFDICKLCWQWHPRVLCPEQCFSSKRTVHMLYNFSSRIVACFANKKFRKVIPIVFEAENDNEIYQWLITTAQIYFPKREYKITYHDCYHGFRSPLTLSINQMEQKGWQHHYFPPKIFLSNDFSVGCHIQLTMVPKTKLN